MKILKTKVKIGDLVVVRWLDHCGFSDATWRDFDEIRDLEPLRILTVGLVASVHKDYINLFATISNSDKTLGEISILTNCIYKIEKVDSTLIKKDSDD